MENHSRLHRERDLVAFCLQPAELGCFQSFLGNAISSSRGDVWDWGIFSLQEDRNHNMMSFSR